MTRDKYRTRVEQLANHAADGNGIENSSGRVIGIERDGALADAISLCDDEMAVRTWSRSQSLAILEHTSHEDAYLQSFDPDICQPLNELTAEEILFVLALAALKSDVVEELETILDGWENPDVDADYNFTNSRHA